MSSTGARDHSEAAPARGFPQAEFEQRTARAQRAMAEAGLDAVLLTTEPNVRYFSGFHTQFWESPTRPWFLVVPLEGRPVAVVPEIGVSGMAATWVEAIHSWPAPRPEDDGISLLGQVLNDLPKRFGRLGVTTGHETHLRMPLRDFGMLIESLRGFEVGDATALVRGLRSIKSPAEIAKVRNACEIASSGFEALPSKIAAGESEREICRKLRIDLLERGADSSPYMIAASGPGGYDNIIMGPTDRRVAEGDLLIIDTGTTFDGYFCDFDRNFSFGVPDEAAVRAHDAVYRATEAGIAASRPGVTYAEVWAVMWPLLEAAGALGNDVGRMGHGLGMQLTEWPSVMPGDETVLEAGMIMTIEPGMAFAPGKLMVHEENIVITEDGCALLSRRAPREMPVID